MVTKYFTSEPEVPLEPSQLPLAEHEEAFVEDQVTVTSSFIYASEGSTEILTVGAGVGIAGTGSLPPPPPPPHDVKTVSYTHLTLPTKA